MNGARMRVRIFVGLARSEKPYHLSSNIIANKCIFLNRERNRQRKRGVGEGSALQMLCPRHNVPQTRTLQKTLTSLCMSPFICTILLAQSWLKHSIYLSEHMVVNFITFSYFKSFSIPNYM